jgi:hypothetical protein
MKHEARNTNYEARNKHEETKVKNVIPANAGIQQGKAIALEYWWWIPACAGMTNGIFLDSVLSPD